jgi:uncharacterized membrane protein
MIKNEMSILIQKPIGEVFDYISDFQNGPQWQTGLLEVRPVTDGPLGVGTRFTSVRKFMGRSTESDIEFSDYELNRKVSIKSVSGNSPFKQTFLFEPTADATRLTSRFELHMGGIMALAEPLMASGVRRELAADFGRLKEVIESHVPEAFELME